MIFFPGPEKEVLLDMEEWINMLSQEFVGTLAMLELKSSC